MVAHLPWITPVLIFVFLEMFQKVYIVLFLCKVAFFVVVEVPLIFEPSFGKSIVEKFEIVFNAVMIEIVSEWNEHHVRDIPAKDTSHYQ